MNLHYFCFYFLSRDISFQSLSLAPIYTAVDDERHGMPSRKANKQCSYAEVDANACRVTAEKYGQPK